MPFTYADEKRTGALPDGFAEARAYVQKHEGDNVVVDVFWYVKRQIFGARERLRTSEIAAAVGHDKRKVRRALMGMFGMLDDDGLWLGYVDKGARSDGHAGSNMRASGVKLGANDYRWEVYGD